jgi:hypothetical protein
MHGGGPRAVAFGDFDGDGRQDIAVACATDLRQDGVSVLSGRPDGGFALPVRYATGTRPRAMAAGDLDGDGRPDLAVANFDSADLSVLRGRPDGSFAPAVRHAAGGGPVAVAIGDLDGDGRPDLAVANNLHLDSVSGGATGNVAVLRNTGDGDLGAAALYAVGRNPSAVAIGDLDGDGRPDLAVVNNGSRNGALEVDDAGSVSVLRGDGRGGFATPVHYPAGVRPFAVAVGDLDGDGRADLAVTTTGARYEDRMVNVLLGQAGGAFAAPVSYLAGFGPRAIALADTGTDGALDLLVLNTGSADVSVLENDGAGHFSAAARYSVGEEPMAVAVGDLNGDGRADLGAVSSVAEDVTVLLGSAGGGYRGARSQATGGSRPTAIGIGDLDRDGTPDLVVLGDKSLTNGSQLAVLLGDGRGGTRTANVYAASDAGSWSPRALALGDLDGDGALDVATASYFGEGVNVALGKGDGTLGDGVHYATGNYTVGLAMGDLDGDGRADLAVANGRNEIGEVSVLRNEGGGTLGAPARLPMGAGTPSSVTLADVNGDGRADLIVPIRINDAAGTVNVLLNAGGGTFAAPASYLTGPSPRMVAAGDLDGDGKPDLAVTNTGNGGVSVLLNAGDGTFARPVGYAAGVQPETVALSDLNGDGSLDLAITGAWSNGVVALVNRGGGRFAPAVRFIAGAAPTALAAGDLDLDGKPDLAVSNGVSATGGGGVTVLLNTTPF